MMKKSLIVLTAASALLSALCFAEPRTTVIDYGNGKKAVVTSDEGSSRIEQGGSKKVTAESHDEAVYRLLLESKARGEKASTSKVE